MQKIHVIIPVYDGWSQTRTCLEALRASTYRDLELIVVDHGPGEEIRKALPAEYPEVIHLLGEPTLWWAGATNLGIRRALAHGAKRIMLLNHDCYVEPDTIQRIAAHAERVGEAIIAPVQLDFLTRRIVGITATTCFLLGFPTVVLPRKTIHLGKPGLLPTKLVLGGRGVLIPSSIFERVGLFDEVNLPSYYSDHDFYLRCKQRGIPLFIAPNATVYIDDTRTTLAARPEALDFGQFLLTLKSPRSHRNLRDLSALFRLHYPIKGFHHLGVALNLLRYCAVYGWMRLRHLFSAG